MKEFKRLEKLLQECVEACSFCAESCKNEENSRDLQHCIELDQECVKMCKTVQHSLKIGSHALSDILQACQGVCVECAEECEKHDHDHCRKCAEACRTCSIECEDVQAELV